MALGIVTGLKFEADIIRKTGKSQNLTHSYASVAGRQERAYEEALSFVEKGARGLISFGIAGGLTDDVPVGTLVLATEIYCGQGGVYKTDPKWRRGLSGLLSDIIPIKGPMVSLPYALETEAQKRGAHSETGAIGVDMESFGVARAAKETGVPFIVIRSISDGASDLLPECVVPAMGPEGQIMLGPVFSGLLKKPGDIPHLIGFGFKTRRANATLRRVCLLGLPFFGLNG